MVIVIILFLLCLLLTILLILCLYCKKKTGFFVFQKHQQQLQGDNEAQQMQGSQADNVNGQGGQEDQAGQQEPNGLSSAVSTDNLMQ